MDEIKRIVQLVADGDREMGDGPAVAEAAAHGYLREGPRDVYVLTSKGRDLLR